MPTLAELVEAIPAELHPRVDGDARTVVLAVSLDSRRVVPGSLFACLPGSTSDGHDHAPEALERGAVALLVERPLALGVTQVVTDDARRALGSVAAAFEGDPSRRLTVCGITGTNGKTTTAHLLAHILEHAGVATGVLGTLAGTFTTPEAPDLQRTLAELLAGGKQAVVMEVSSHALALHRVSGTHFSVAVFTNLGRDHLDFHGSMEEYFGAKSRLFGPGYAEAGVIWTDDPHGCRLAAASSIPVTQVRMIDAVDLALEPSGSSFTWNGHAVRLPLLGRHNVANALLAATAATVLGIDAGVAAEALASARPVPGRAEPVDAGQAFGVLVDYAHTPEALQALLDSLRELTASRLLLVFGCGGDRDADKRPLMGRVATEHADLVIVTSDNPRREDPEAIIDQVLAGVPDEHQERVVRESDREAAITLAIASAEPGDIVVLAGKGHETTQTVGTDVRPFDDRVVAREAIDARAAR